MFRKYMHIEKYGNDRVQGIELGETYIFPKIDGTNASVWYSDSSVQAGSRNRHLSLDNDNAGFLQYLLSNENLIKFIESNPRLRLYGEWLVPHSLKTYTDGSWRKFYIFDVFSDLEDTYLTYDEYQPLLESFELDYIPPTSIIKNATYDNLLLELEHNTFLIKDGEGIGEGVVIKNYKYINKYGNLLYAKIVRNSFKDIHRKEMGATEKIGSDMIEQYFIDKYLPESFIDKEYAKIVNQGCGWSSKDIPRLFNTTYHELINEELWNILKNKKNPTINFKTLYSLVVIKIKQTKPELF